MVFRLSRRAEISRQVQRSASREYLDSKSCGVERELKALLKEDVGYLEKTPESLVNEKIKPFTERLVKDPVEGWKTLMDFGDKYSVRQFFQDKFVSLFQKKKTKKRPSCLHSGRYDYDTIEWLETYS